MTVQFSISIILENPGMECLGMANRSHHQTIEYK